MKTIGMSPAILKPQHVVVEKHAKQNRDERGRALKSEIKAIRMDVLREIRFNSAVSQPVLLAKQKRITINIDEVGKKLARKGLFGKTIEAVKCVAHRGLYFERRKLRELHAFVNRHIGDRPEDCKYKVLPTRTQSPTL
ncbi:MULTISPECIES: hypothetical protein [Burkholderia]|uniref:hypothetical protein n=1 Tax=Burkholderia TaxID=32008 RepID=UPI0007590D12|nr:MULTISPECIES: hypothetical protein [Burkholderia]AOJ73614.1 hypothetical protein WS78_32035 [Burkholderia savannae]KVG41399.1 hypothetical protein WS77_17155 [Burkholderia sp. MSMB0265]KVG87918.1 hypothetical protein WS81_25490 [Burkholderia sp. MSMB2040]KVG96489.1 hypothetical protein WS82_31990 [Burkholderia sp. MSMB2041]KVH01636.1 hypothetical protein WS83_18045 [Burkholderia sp. MSMB2042]